MSRRIVLPDDGLDLSRLSPEAERLWNAGYFRGLVHGREAGYAEGWAAADEAAAVVWARCVEVVRAKTRDMRTFSQLERDRGQTPSVEQVARERWLMFGEEVGA